MTSLLLAGSFFIIGTLFGFLLVANGLGAMARTRLNAEDKVVFKNLLDKIKNNR